MAVPMSRRRLLVDLGRTTLGLVVVSTGLGACVGDAEAPGTGAGSDDPGLGDPGSVSPTTGASPTSTASDSPLAIGLVDLDFVAAYVVARAGQAAVIDTGVAGSEDAIRDVLSGLGLDWTAVGDVIVTHSHADHAGSVAAVATAASEATLWAGAADIPAIEAPRTIEPVDDGDSVFDLRIVATPGHTPGHVSVFDPASATLFTGDALAGDGDALAGPGAQFTADMATARASVAELALLEPERILVAHGFPVAAGSLELAELAASFAVG